MNSSDFASKMLKGRGFSSAPLLNNYNKSVNTKEEQDGRSMIEMLGVLAIIGVLSVGGIAGYSKAMQRYRINKTIEQITLIAGNIHSFFGPQKNYDGVSNNTVIRKAKLVPEEMWEYNTSGAFIKFTNVFDGDFGLSLAGIVESFNTGFKFVLTKIPEDVCIELLSQDWNSTNMKVICKLDSQAKCILPPVDIDKAIQVCKNSDNAYLNFLFDYDYTKDGDTMYFLN